jgi:hypothetical protein
MIVRMASGSFDSCLLFDLLTSVSNQDSLVALLFLPLSCS